MKIQSKFSKPLIGFICSLGILALPAGARAHVISEADHHAFEHKFAEMCVEKEKAKAQARAVNEMAVAELCECIAKEESKRLTIEEVRKFVKENKYPVSLMIKSNAATYTCIKK
jgi:hypothetical protein